MAVSRRRKGHRKRVGQVSYYFHHGSWYIYHRDGPRQVRRRVADTEEEAAQIAAQVNAQLAASLPTAFSFTPIDLPELRRRFLEYHEHVLRSSLGTVRRYRSATQHLENFVLQHGRTRPAHTLDAEAFTRYLRSIRIAPNGHENAKRRSLRDKGVRYVLETCRSMYAYAARKRHLPPYADNPFAGLGGKRFKVEDAKPIYVFDEGTEANFLSNADDWSFPIHFVLAKTGMRPGELIHLLIEDLDLASGWLRISNKPELGWRIKTRRERDIPLADEVIGVLRRVVGGRAHGPVFVRQRFDASVLPLAGVDRDELTHALEDRLADAEGQSDSPLTRERQAKIARSVWRDAGVVRADAVRNSYIRTMQLLGNPRATCPKSWRHTFATLLQDAGVDPLVRQITLGHAPTNGAEGALGMTAVYTHTRPETQKREIVRALRLWPNSLQLARHWSQGGASCQ